MSIDPWEAEQEAAYDDFVDSLSKELYEEHKEQAIEEFVNDRLRSYYMDNPGIAVSARLFGSKAKEHIDGDPTSSLIYSSIATEVIIKSVILKPIISGLVHSEAVSELVASLLIKQSGVGRFNSLIFKISNNYAGIDLSEVKRKNSKKLLWQERNDIQEIRNKIMHQAADCTKEQAKLSYDIALHIFWVAKELIEELGFKFEKNGNISSKNV